MGQHADAVLVDGVSQHTALLDCRRELICGHSGTGYREEQNVGEDFLDNLGYVDFDVGRHREFDKKGFRMDLVAGDYRVYVSKLRVAGHGSLYSVTVFDRGEHGKLLASRRYKNFGEAMTVCVSALRKLGR